MFAFFPMVINTYQGVKSVDPKLLEVGRAFRCSEGQLWAQHRAAGVAAVHRHRHCGSRSAAA